MSQIDFTELTTEWKPFSEITTVDADVTYRIQNRGAFPIIALEADSTPSEDNKEGNIANPYDTIIYKKGTQDLYLRSFDSVTSINVTAED